MPDAELHIYRDDALWLLATTVADTADSTHPAPVIEQSTLDALAIIAAVDNELHWRARHGLARRPVDTGYPRTWLDELRQRTDLAAMIGLTVSLCKRGRAYVGRCPFIEERTPSFTVWTDHYHCFGCGAHGDAITWVQSIEQCDFRAAVERLASAAGMSPPPPPTARGLRTREVRRG